MNHDTKSSISKLRSLREKLCKQQDHRKEVFETRDDVICEIKFLKKMINNQEISRECVSNKIDSILLLLDPALNIEVENV